MEKIKCFIINRNLLTWPKAMVEWMHRVPNLEPIILDNASDYAPLLDWYDTDPCRVIRFNDNYGHTVLWSSGIYLTELKDTEYFILTDPDLDMSTIPIDVIDKLKEGINKHNVNKCGLAIRIDDIPNEYPLKDQVLFWENGFWNNYLEDDYYLAPVDTTFALHKTEKSRSYKIGGIRTGGNYTTRHLPFYLTPDTVTDEIDYYFCNCNKTISTQAKYLQEWTSRCINERK